MQHNQNQFFLPQENTGSDISGPSNDIVHNNQRAKCVCLCACVWQRVRVRGAQHVMFTQSDKQIYSGGEMLSHWSLQLQNLKR